MHLAKINLAQIIVQAVYSLPAPASDADTRVVALAQRSMIELEALAAPARSILADAARDARTAIPADSFADELEREGGATWTPRQADLFIQLSHLDWCTVRGALQGAQTRTGRDHTQRVVIEGVIAKLDAAMWAGA